MCYIKYILFLFISFVFSQQFVAPARYLYNYIKWEEISADQIIYQKVGPFLDFKQPSLKIANFYNAKIDSNQILNSELFSEIKLNKNYNDKIRFYGSVNVKLSKTASIQNEFEFDSYGQNDDHFQGIQRELIPGWVGYLQHSSLNYQYNQGSISLGRGNPFFYNLNHSLLINPNFPPSEFIWWQHNINKYFYDWGVLLLNNINSLNRFLTFHRYGIKKKNYSIGFTEAVIASYKNFSSSEIGYIMPSAVLIETEANRGINANLMWLFDFKFKWNKYTIYGEYLIDDFAIDRLSPPQTGLNLGLGKKVKSNILNIDYTKINRWVGNYCDTSLVHTWLEMDVPIGHPLGSDAHQLLISNYIIINQKLNVQFLFRGIQSGDGIARYRLKQWPHDVKCENNFGYFYEPFPSKINNSYFYEIEAFYFLKEDLMFNINMTFSKNEKPNYYLSTNYRFF